MWRYDDDDDDDYDDDDDDDDDDDEDDDNAHKSKLEFWRFNTTIPLLLLWWS